MPEIYLAVIEEAHLKETNEGGVRRREMDIYIPENPVVIDYDRKQPPWFWVECIDRLRETGNTEIASHENPVISPSAGAISFFHDSNGEVRYVAMSQKDAEAPRDPGFLVPRNGFPQSQEDWFTMEHLYREAYEEGIILTKKYELVLPQDGKNEDEIIRRAELLQQKTPLRIKGDIRVPIVFKDGPDTLNVYRMDGTRACQENGFLSWTPETNINLIKIMEVQYPIDELLLVDPETKLNGELIGRDYCIIDLELLQGKEFGDPIHERVHRLKEGNEFLPEVKVLERDDLFLVDKSPRSVLCQFLYKGKPVYPIDWMDESYEFLSRHDVQEAFNRAFAFSDFEMKLKVKKQ